jgi:tetratricopeptide (TPR) repeat protein
MAEDVIEVLRRAVAAHQGGRLAEAEAGYRAVLKRQATQVDALNLLGVLLSDRGETAAAVALFDRALAAAPRFAAASFNKANALAGSGDTAGAEAAYRTALKLKPDDAAAWVNLGALLHRAGRLEDAIAALREATRLSPQDPRGHFNLGRCFIDHKRPAEAVAPLQVALALAPDDFNTHLALGDAYADLGDTDAARRHLSTAITLNPKSAQALSHLGTLLVECERHQDAVAAYNAAIAADPTFVSARVNRGMARLSLGELATGWSDYAHRKDDPSVKNKRAPKPITPWTGQDLAGQSILVSADQGLGDEILYAAMLPDLAARAGAVTFECSPRLLGLFARSYPEISVVPGAGTGKLKDFSQFAYGSSLIDIGQWLRPDMASFKSQRRRLKVDPQSAETFTTWSRAARASGRLVVGCSWSSANPEFGRFKSIPLARWAGLFATPGVDFVDLQYGRSEEASSSDNPSVFHPVAFDRTIDFEALASHIAALDLVITVSNTTAHLSAALGVPTWILVPSAYGRLWYWFVEGRHSPWYPSARLFRLSSQQNDDALMAPVTSALGAMIKDAREHVRP